jgi:AraC-like DNA-binding protein
MIDLDGDGLRVADRHDPRSMRTFRESLVYGAHARWYIVEAGRHVSRMGVHFKPGGAHPFFGQAASALHGMHVPLDALWGRTSVEELRERLCAGITPEARFQTLERVLLAHLRHNYARHPAVAVALGALLAFPKPRTIRQIVDQSGLSHRHFIEVFRNEVGMSPKRFCRLRRFLEVVRRTQGTDQVNWAQVALACGYYDQSHLINDFREFAGVCPMTYLHDRDARFPTYLPFTPTKVNDLQASV